jgi:hypothetical protein
VDEEFVTVIDPRHPLYQQTFHLLGITTKQYLGRCCIVWDLNQNERFIPLCVTNLAPDPLFISALPLCLTSLQQLVLSYTQLLEQLAKEEDHHELPIKSTDRTNQPAPTVSGSTSHSSAACYQHPTHPTVELPFTSAAASSLQIVDQHLSQSLGQARQSGGGRRI